MNEDEIRLLIAPEDMPAFEATASLRAITAAIEAARADGHGEVAIRAVTHANFPGSLQINLRDSVFRLTDEEADVLAEEEER